MNTIPSSQPRFGIIPLVRWTARIGSIISLAILSAFLFGEPGTPTLTQGVALAFFPAGVAIGMVIGWWREGLGGTVTIISLAAFYLWMTLANGLFPRGPYFVLFAAPGLLFLAASALRKLKGMR